MIPLYLLPIIPGFGRTVGPWSNLPRWMVDVERDQTTWYNMWHVTSETWLSKIKEFDEAQKWSMRTKGNLFGREKQVCTQPRAFETSAKTS